MNIYENGILEAFNITRAGGDAPLFDEILMGRTINPGTSAANGQGAVNGTTLTGSAALRGNSTFRPQIANGNVGQFADSLHGSTIDTARAGGLLGNKPSNFIKVNPQFGLVTLDGNPGNSTYHAMNLQLTKRLSHGFTGQMAYSWSRTIGNDSNDGGFGGFATSNHYFNPRDRSLNKTLVSFHRTHDIRSNGTFELPFGPNRPFLNSAPGFVTRLVEQWQLGGIFFWSSGAPLSLSSPLSTITQANINMPVILGNFPKSAGEITKVAQGANYFADYRQIDDSARTGVTNLQLVQGQFTNKAITDANGNVILENPAPGQLGTLGQRWIEGPGHIGLDLNLVKRVRISESKLFEVRVDVRNALNTPWWADPETNINSLNFGRMLGSGTTGSSNADNRNGTRTFTLNARLSF